MIDAKTLVRTALINNTTLTALVDADSIFPAWLNDTTTYPCICIIETNCTNDDMSYHDSHVFNDMVEIELHIFSAPDTDNFAIKSAIAKALEPAWNRDFCTDMQDISGLSHTVMRYSTRKIR